jgi:hypothetical protein
MESPQANAVTILPMESVLTPGLVIAERPCSPEVLLHDWNSSHLLSLPVFEFPFTYPKASDIEDINWNGREAIRRCAKGRGLPQLWRAHWMPMDPANACLIFSVKRLTETWQQVLHPAAFPTLPEAALRELLPVCTSAACWYQQAKLKFNRLAEQPRALQQFSLRQWRFHFFISRALDDLGAVVRQICNLQPANEQLGEIARHLTWHTDELHRLVSAHQTPDLLQRLSAPRFDINRLAATCCIHHATLLERLIDSP